MNRTISMGEENLSGVVVPAARETAVDAEEGRFVDALRAGDTAAFDRLMGLYTGEIFGLLYRLTENAEEAGDLTQDTFMRAFRSICGFRGNCALKTWLYRIAINESRNRFRFWKRRRRSSMISIDACQDDSLVSFADSLVDGAVDPEAAALRKEREYLLRTALSELSDAYREAIVLCDIQGMSYEETAQALGINLGTAKSRISRGRNELRKKLKDI